MKDHERAALRDARDTIAPSLPIFLIEVEERHRKDTVVSMLMFYQGRLQCAPLFHINRKPHPIEHSLVRPSIKMLLPPTRLRKKLRFLYIVPRWHSFAHQFSDNNEAITLCPHGLLAPHRHQAGWKIDLAYPLREQRIGYAGRTRWLVAVRLSPSRGRCEVCDHRRHAPGNVSGSGA